MAEVGDIICYHQATSQPDAWEFAQLLIKDVNMNVDNKDLELFPCSKVTD